MATYVKTTWIDDQAPAIDAVNLNHIEDGIYGNSIDIGNIIGGTTVVGKASTADALTVPIVVPVASPVGGIIMWGGTTVPTKHLECNGQTLLRTHALFAILGTNFGAGDGVTTFNIPDLRGVFTRGWDHGRGVDAGRTIGSFQEDAFESHTHSIKYANALNGGGGGANIWQDDGSSIPTQATGDTETRPKNTALMYIIKSEA